MVQFRALDGYALRSQARRSLQRTMLSMYIYEWRAAKTETEKGLGSLSYSNKNDRFSQRWCKFVEEIPSAMRAIETRNIGFRYPGGPVLFSDVNIHLKSGECVALTGPSGCGSHLCPHFRPIIPAHSSDRGMCCCLVKTFEIS